MQRGLTLLALVLATGCYTVRYRTDQAPSGQRHEQRLNYWAVGLVGEHVVDLDQYCPTGPAAWRTEARPLDTFFTFVTLGVWAPRHVVVECGEPK